MVCQKLQSASPPPRPPPPALFFFFLHCKKNFLYPKTALVLEIRIVRILVVGPLRLPHRSLWSSVFFVMLWAACFITWSNKPLLLAFPIVWCKSQMEADIFLCCQLSFPINIRAGLKVENKAMFELSNHKMHLKNAWACEKHPPFTCSAASEMSGWNLSWEQAWRITEQVAPVFSLKSVPQISASNQCALDQRNGLLADSQGASFTVILPAEFPVRMLSTWMDVCHRTWVLYRKDASWGARYTCTGP